MCFETQIMHPVIMVDPWIHCRQVVLTQDNARSSCSRSSKKVREYLHNAIGSMTISVDGVGSLEVQWNHAIVKTFVAVTRRRRRRIYTPSAICRHRNTSLANEFSLMSDAHPAQPLTTAARLLKMVEEQVPASECMPVCEKLGQEVEAYVQEAQQILHDAGLTPPDDEGEECLAETLCKRVEDGCPASELMADVKELGEEVKRYSDFACALLAKLGLES